jgi:hypothetical protein
MMRGLAPAFRQEESLQIRLADFLRAGFLLLGERTSEEIVVGVLWGRTNQAVTPEQFIELDDPGHTKVAMNFAMRPHDTGTLVTTETRAFSTDDGARRRFARYWLIIRPFSGLIRRRMLAVLRDQVLRSPTQPGP